MQDNITLEESQIGAKTYPDYLLRIPQVMIQEIMQQGLNSSVSILREWCKQWEQNARGLETNQEDKARNDQIILQHGYLLKYMEDYQQSLVNVTLTNGSPSLTVLESSTVLKEPGRIETSFEGRINQLLQKTEHAVTSISTSISGLQERLDDFMTTTRTDIDNALATVASNQQTILTNEQGILTQAAQVSAMILQAVNDATTKALAGEDFTTEMQTIASLQTAQQNTITSQATAITNLTNATASSQTPPVATVPPVVSTETGDGSDANIAPTDGTDQAGTASSVSTPSNPVPDPSIVPPVVDGSTDSTAAADAASQISADAAPTS
jgi:hypothetical protein